MSITYRPPFDEDDELDLRALYRKPRPGSSPELDAAVRRIWHPGHSWHPGWAAAACAVMVAGLFAWTDMREAEQEPAQTEQVIAAQDSKAAPRAVMTGAQPAATTQRVSAPLAEPAASHAVLTQPESPAAPEAAAAQGETAAAQTAAYSEQQIETSVAQIRTLIVDDREQEAVQALRILQQEAPDLTLPDDLQELARQHSI